MSLRIAGAVKRSLNAEADRVYRQGGLIVFSGTCCKCGAPAYAKERLSGGHLCREHWGQPEPLQQTLSRLNADGASDMDRERAPEPSEEKPKHKPVWLYSRTSEFPDGRYCDCCGDPWPCPEATARKLR